MNKKQIRLTESDLKQIVKDSVGKILKEAKKKDPMRQWFKDMEDIQKHRDNMEYITKGGRKPKHWNESDLHRIVKESVNRILKETNGMEWFHSGDEDLSREFEAAHERLHKKYRGKLSPQEIERMAEYEVYGAPKLDMPQGNR